MRCWCGYLSGARYRLFAYGPADATAIPTVASFKSRLVLPYWYWLIQVVLEKRPLNGCSSSSFKPPPILQLGLIAVFLGYASVLTRAFTDWLAVDFLNISCIY